MFPLVPLIQPQNPRGACRSPTAERCS